MEREESPCDRLNVVDTIDRGVADTHAEVQVHTSVLVLAAHIIQQSNNINYFLQMCSPAELRQQSEELYAVIDEILADSIPAVRSINYMI